MTAIMREYAKRGEKLKPPSRLAQWHEEHVLRHHIGALRRHLAALEAAQDSIPQARGNLRDLLDYQKARGFPDVPGVNWERLTTWAANVGTGIFLLAIAYFALVRGM